jgi:hypothetical protein
VLLKVDNERKNILKIGLIKTYIILFVAFNAGLFAQPQPVDDTVKCTAGRTKEKPNGNVKEFDPAQCFKAAKTALSEKKYVKARIILNGGCWLPTSWYPSLGNKEKLNVADNCKEAAATCINFKAECQDDYYAMLDYLMEACSLQFNANNTNASSVCYEYAQTFFNFLDILETKRPAEYVSALQQSWNRLVAPGGKYSGENSKNVESVFESVLQGRICNIPDEPAKLVDPGY